MLISLSRIDISSLDTSMCGPVSLLFKHLSYQLEHPYLGIHVRAHVNLKCLEVINIYTPAGERTYLHTDTHGHGYLCIYSCELII